MSDATPNKLDAEARIAKVRLSLTEFERLEKTLEEQKAKFDADLDAILTPKLRKKMELLKEEFEAQIDGVTKSMKLIEAKLRDDVVALGETVKGETKQAVFVNGRRTWETDGLEGYAVDHPDILRFRKVGDPSVAIKKMK